MKSSGILGPLDGLCLLLLSHAALAALNGTHILSDTPSYLRTRGGPHPMLQSLGGAAAAEDDGLTDALRHANGGAKVPQLDGGALAVLVRDAIARRLSPWVAMAGALWGWAGSSGQSDSGPTSAAWISGYLCEERSPDPQFLSI